MTKALSPAEPLAGRRGIPSRGVLAAFVAVVILAPLVLRPFQVSLLDYIALYALVALGLVLLTGIGGLTSFGQAAFVGVGAYATAGASYGSQQGPNVLLDGLEYSNNLARDRAIIIHGADYADPAFLAREGKLGRSYGCFSVSHADLVPLRERMGEGRLLFAMT